MSELIQNQQYRQDKLKELIKRLHTGSTVEEVQEEFDKLTTGVTATEIAQMEQALVNEGMPVADIQRLCDVHAAVFKGSIVDIHKDVAAPVLTPGHPALTLKEENIAIQDFLDKEVRKKLKNFIANGSEKNHDALTDSIKELLLIDKHYSRKENLIFPIMEKYDITAPPQVMWGVDDEIREKIKAVIDKLEGPPAAPFQIDSAVSEMANQISEMIFKEENIMIPMVLDKFSIDDWQLIEESSAQIGFTLIDPPARWDKSAATEPTTAPTPAAPLAKKPAPTIEAPEKAAPVKPAPVEPAPEIIVPVKPIPEPPTPIKPAPVEAAPVKPAPAVVMEDIAAPVKPTPEQPAPIKPAAVKPAPEKAAPVKPAPQKAAPISTVPDVVLADSQTQIMFDAGSLTSEQVNALLNTIPLDMTFVGADNRVKYFTQGKERVFDRPPTVIGRQVSLCHPPKSVHVVEQIVNDLRSGKKDSEDFWIRMGETFAYIRYFAVRNKQGEFLGTLEVTQDIKAITELEGEKRLRK